MSADRPRFLSVEQVLELHQDAIKEYGGDTGLRDRGLLESAVAQPRTTFGGGFLHADLPAMAAGYLFHLAKNHAFVDGNKRIAAYAAGVFLDVNGLGLSCSEAEYEDVVLRVAKGEIGKDEVIKFFRAMTHPIE